MIFRLARILVALALILVLIIVWTRCYLALLGNRGLVQESWGTTFVGDDGIDAYIEVTVSSWPPDSPWQYAVSAKAWILNSASTSVTLDRDPQTACIPLGYRASSRTLYLQERSRTSMVEITGSWPGELGPQFESLPVVWNADSIGFVWQPTDDKYPLSIPSTSKRVIDHSRVIHALLAPSIVTLVSVAVSYVVIIALNHGFRLRCRRLGLCMVCGYDLQGSMGERCPECGSKRLRIQC